MVMLLSAIIALTGIEGWRVSVRRELSFVSHTTTKVTA